jgi:hypothetical protein
MPHGHRDPYDAEVEDEIPDGRNPHWRGMDITDSNEGSHEAWRY